MGFDTDELRSVSDRDGEFTINRSTKQVAWTQSIRGSWIGCQSHKALGYSTQL